MTRIYDHFERVSLTSTAATYGIMSEADYERFAARCDDPGVDPEELGDIYHAMGDWALAHHRLEEARRIYDVGWARCLAAGASPYATNGLAHRLADLLDSAFHEGDGDSVRLEWLATLETRGNAGDSANAVFFAHEAYVCVCHGRLALAKSILDQLEAAMCAKDARRRRKIAHLLRQFAEGHEGSEGGNLLLDAAARIESTKRRKR